MDSSLNILIVDENAQDRAAVVSELEKVFPGLKAAEIGGAGDFAQEDITKYKRAEESLQKRNEELAAINAIAATVNQFPDLDYVLSTTLIETEKALGLSHSEIWLLNEPTNQLRPSAYHGLPDDFALKIPGFDVGVGLPGIVAQDRHPLLITDLEADSRFLRVRGKAYNLHSALGVPLMNQEKLVGVMNFFNHTSARFTSEIVECLVTIGHLVGTAIGNARLYEAAQHELSERKKVEAEIEHRNQQLETLSLLGPTIAASLELRVVLDKVVAAVSSLVNSEGASVLLLENSDELCFAAASGAGANGLRGQTIPATAGIAGRVNRTGESVLIHGDSDQVMIYREVESKSNYHTQSLLAVPLELNGEIIGVMEAVHSQPDAFSDDDLQMLEAAATWVAIAIGNARQHETIHRKLLESQALTDVSRALIETFDPERILQLIVDSAIRIIFKAERSVIHLFDEEQILHPVAIASFVELDKPSLNMRPSEGVAGKVIVDGVIINIRDTLRDERFLRVDDYLTSTRSLLVAPIQSSSSRLGTISVSSSETSAFTSDDEQLLATFGIQAALAIESAQLYTTATRRARHLELLTDLARTALQTLDLDTVLQPIANQLSQLLGADGCYITRWDEIQQRTIPTAAYGPLHEQYRSIVIEPGEPTITEAVLHAGKTMVVEDTLHSPHISQRIARKFPGHTLLAVPMLVRGQKLGAVLFSFNTFHPFTAEEIGRADYAVGQLSLAVANAQLFESTRLRLKETNTLYRINKEVASSVDPNDIFQKVVDLLWKDFGYYYVQIYLIDQENEVLALQAGSGEIGAQLKSQGYIMAPDKGIVGRVARTNQHFLTNDVSAVDFYVPHSLLPLTHAELALPLRVREKTLGVLDLQHRPPNTFDDDDLGLMTTIADQVAVAIEKTKLYRDLQEALKKEKKTRAHLVKTDKLAAMGRLLASVAHELNNPLQGIQNALYLVKLEPGLSQQAHEDLDLTLSEANRMSELINRLWSTYQPVTSDEFHLEDINVIVSEVHKLTMTHMRHSNITFEFESDPIFPLISCIRDQIKQVLLNLVLNGVDAMPEGGKLSVYLQYHANEDGVRIIVEDTGMGIDPDDLLNIFDPFFTTKPGGTGLGLAITYDIIQKHQGHIDVESQMGEGTAFKIWLPFKHE